MINKIDITIVIPHMDTEKANYALGECLASLRESDFPMNQVIVAFNGDALNAQGLDCRWLYVPEQGQCKAVNAAVAISNTSWVIVTNNDMIYPPDWFERLTDFSWFSEKQPMCVSPMLVEPQDGAPTFIKHFCGGAGGDFDKQKFLDFAKHWMVATPNKWRTGFNLPFLIKREVWDLVGGYDVNYDPFSSNSDSDLEYKLMLAGIQPYQNTNCPVYHFSQTSGTFEPKNRSYWEKNWQYFIDKWGFPRTDEGIWEATFKIPYDKLKFKPKWAVLPDKEPL